MLRAAFNFLATVAFVMFLPFLYIAAWLWGSADEKLLMKICACALGPLCGALWYAAVAGRRFSYLVQFLIVVGGYIAVVWLLKERIVSF